MGTKILSMDCISVRHLSVASSSVPAKSKIDNDVAADKVEELDDHGVEVTTIGDTGSVILATARHSNRPTGEGVGHASSKVFGVTKDRLDRQDWQRQSIEALTSESVSIEIPLVQEIFPGRGGDQSLDDELSLNDNDSHSSQTFAPRQLQDVTPVLDQLLERLGKGVTLTLHDDESVSGRTARFSVLPGNKYICIAPPNAASETAKGAFLYQYERTRATKSDRSKAPETWDPTYIPIERITRLHVGKQLSKVLSRPVLSHVPAKLCFSIIYTPSDVDASDPSKESRLDLEARSELERETVVSSIIVVLEHSLQSADSVSHSEPESDAAASVIERPKEQPQNQPIPRVVESPGRPPLPSGTLSSPSKKVRRLLPSKKSMSPLRLILSPHKRTFIHNGIKTGGKSVGSSPPSLVDEGTETSLVPTQCASHDTETSANEATPLPRLSMSSAAGQKVHPLDDVKEGASSTELIVSGVPDEQPSHEIRNLLSAADDQSDTSDQSGPENEVEIERVLEKSVEDHPLLAAETSTEWCNHFCALAVNDMAEICADVLINIEGDGAKRTRVAFFGTFPATGLNICVGKTPIGLFNASDISPKQRQIESSVEALVGSPYRLASSLFEGKVWSVEDSKLSVEAKSEPAEYRRRLRNRAAVLNAQAKRMRQLRSEMTFHDTIRTATERMEMLESPRSLDDDDTERIRIGPRFGSSNVTPSGGCGIYSFDLLLDFVAGNGSMSRESGKATDDFEDLYYDSDPGEGPYRSSGKGPRRASLQKHGMSLLRNFNRHPHLSEDSDEDRHDTVSPNGSSRATKCSRDRSAPVRGIRHLDDDVVSEFIKNMTSDSMNLLWHRIPESSVLTQIPVRVKAWIELGSRLPESFIQPKLMWSTANEPNLDRRRLSISGTRPESVQLLDICRVVETSIINRDIHPYAKKSCSFVIETREEIHLFEAPSEAERNRVVCGLKCVVARLVSRLIVGDKRVFVEFFTDGMASVPGTRPNLAAAYDGDVSE